MASTEEQRALLMARRHRHSGASLGEYLADVAAALADLQQRDVIGRVWRYDHTVWKPDPTGITDRLGWLTVTDTMRQQVSFLQAFGQEVRDAGFRHLVLLGMGGSSLGPEVLRQAFGSAPGYPELIVLDSTVPDWVRGVAEAIDPARTLFLVSSKSGSTTEPNMFYAYFKELVDKAVGKEQAGQNFIAVTDPGTPLEELAQKNGFRRLFLNPTDIGGRYSVLSYFGLVPAALTGIDIVKLLDSADSMRQGSDPSVDAPDNPGAWLGSVMAVMAGRGRNKLTLVTSPAINSFGLWVEQLLAESTGKEGTGIVPVAGEPLAVPGNYGDDRLFVYLRLEGDDNNECDAAFGAIESSGQPAVRLDLRDKYDLGAEFFRWELATAVAGAGLGIQPFDQPNVQAAKDMTDSVLSEFSTSGELPEMEASTSLDALLEQTRRGDYLAVMAYLRQTPEIDHALNELRRKVTEKYHLATTLGYGPRFLHSTGQLHKGGPDSGLFLQLTADREQDLAIPGEVFTFGVLADAQALGDLRALRAAGRRAARVHLGSSPEAGILGMAHGVA